MKPATIILPQSKSMSARALILDWLSGGSGNVNGLSDCQDTVELRNALAQLGRGQENGRTYWLGNGATSLRFFIALVASIPGFDGIVTCTPQLGARPIAPLITALTQAGAKIQIMPPSRESHKFALHVKGAFLDATNIRLDSRHSSQFASALVLASQLWKKPWLPDPHICNAYNLEQPISVPSSPYLQMTLRMLSAWKKGETLEIEPDWSAASYFYEYAALHPEREVCIDKLIPPEKSLQGDSVCARLFAKLGVVTEFSQDGSALVKQDVSALVKSLRNHNEHISLDFRDCPDLVPAYACAAAGKGIDFTARGVENLRFKECDRLDALAVLLHSAGWHTEQGESELRVTGLPKDNLEVLVNPRGDHRMAMSFGVLATKYPWLEIADKDCVAKSYPGFFDTLSKLQHI